MTSQPKFPAWSFSSLQLFEQCPAKWSAKYVTKTYKEPEQEHQVHGVRSHSALEARIRDKTPLPPDLVTVDPFLLAIEKMNPTETLVEYQIGLTENRDPTGFFAKDVWWRGVIDAAFIKGDLAVALDHKMGKRKADFTQLQLFAAALMVHRPEIQKVKMVYGWWKYLTPPADVEEAKKRKKDNPQNRILDSGTLSRAGLPIFWGAILPRVQRMQYAFENDHYFEKPGPLCGWCWHSGCKHCPNKG